MFSPCFSVARRVSLLKLKVRSRNFSERGLGGHCRVIMTSFYNSFRVVALGTAGVPQGSRCPPSAGTPCCPEVPGGGSEAAAPHVPTVWGRHAAWSRDLWAVAQTVAAGPQGQPHPSVPCARDPGGSRGAGGVSSGQAQGAESRGGLLLFVCRSHGLGRCVHLSLGPPVLKRHLLVEDAWQDA